ncbi:hypothetical protein ACOI1C_12205 [Bacillus sp. DJP31]|uniref:hypothetical protein n=1 Tax=Bacillus sp. DJP31 TaxID=3409789 RepID=UPI003BB6B1A2
MKKGHISSFGVFIHKFTVLAFVFILAVGCSNSETDLQGSDENVKKSKLIWKMSSQDLVTK